MNEELECRQKGVSGRWPLYGARMRSWQLICILCVCVMVSSCASGRLIEHGIQPEVKGKLPVYDIQVIYGEKVINFRGIHQPGFGGGWDAPMPIPDVMIVRWTVQQEQKTVTIPLRARVHPRYEIRNWILRFDGRELELIREVATGRVDPVTYLEPRERMKVFP